MTRIGQSLPSQNEGLSRGREQEPAGNYNATDGGLGQNKEARGNNCGAAVFEYWSHYFTVG